MALHEFATFDSAAESSPVDPKPRFKPFLGKGP